MCCMRFCDYITHETVKILVRVMVSGAAGRVTKQAISSYRKIQNLDVWVCKLSYYRKRISACFCLNLSRNKAGRAEPVLRLPIYEWARTWWDLVNGSGVQGSPWLKIPVIFFAMSDAKNNPIP